MRWLGRKRIRRARGTGAANVGSDPKKDRVGSDPKKDRAGSDPKKDRAGSDHPTSDNEHDSSGLDAFASDSELPEGNSLPEISLRRPVSVLVMTAALLVLGFVSVTRLKLDFLPQIDFPFLGIFVPYPNAVPAQVEKEIARPIEEILATLGGVKRLESYSGADGAFVGVEFEFDRNVDVLRMEVKDRMEKVRPQLPTDVRDSQIFTFN